MKVITIPTNKGWGEIPEYKTMFNITDELATYIKGLENTIDKYSKELDKTRISELEKEYKINTALKIIDEKRGEYDIPDELEKALKGE